MKITIEWEDNSKHILQSERPQFTITNKDKNMLKSITVESKELSDEEIIQAYQDIQKRYRV
jgi:hypothetical protein